jgi:endonuclease YncB( thermonuclease family)
VFGAVAGATGPIQNPRSIETGPVDVIGGATVRSGGQVYRLVGCKTPESGLNARCGRERALASDARRRLRQLVAGGE